MHEEFKVVSPVAMLGYGVREDALSAVMELGPHAIGVDAGSTDAGPYKLGAGRADVSAEMTERDIALSMRAAREAGIPFIIGSAGGSGGEPHVRWTLERVRNVLREMAWQPNVGVIWADVPLTMIGDAMRDGRLGQLDEADPTRDRLLPQHTEVAVAQMGYEPIISALDEGFEVIVAGRSVDSAIFAAPAIRAGMPPEQALHAGEIIECASLCASPGSAREAAVATVRRDGFRIESGLETRACTPASVCAHSLYERTNPFITQGPGYELDLTESKFVAVDARAVEVSGTRIRSRPLTVKVEGVRRIGFRTIVVAGVRDPIAVETLGLSLEEVLQITEHEFESQWKDVVSVRFLQYGKDAVMGPREFELSGPNSHELGLVIDVIAQTEELSETVCGFLRATLQHFMYPGIKATGANLAFPFSPSDIRCGAVHEFTVYHQMAVDRWQDVFRVEEFNMRSLR
jgi:hypothetical protein